MKSVTCAKRSHKKGCYVSVKQGNSKFTRPIPLNDFHSLKTKMCVSTLKDGTRECLAYPRHMEHWILCARLIHGENCRTKASWGPLKFANRLAVVTSHYTLTFGRLAQ